MLVVGDIDDSADMWRRTNLALNRYAVGSRPADRKVARALVECSFLNVRFAADSDRRADMLACLKCAMKRHSTSCRITLDQGWQRTDNSRPPSNGSVIVRNPLALRKAK
jgi:hypothetical protein